MRMSDFFAFMANNTSAGWLTAHQGANRRRRRSEPKRDRQSTRMGLTDRQQRERDRQDKHKRRTRQASQRINRRKAH